MYPPLLPLPPASPSYLSAVPSISYSPPPASKDPALALSAIQSGLFSREGQISLTRVWVSGVATYKPTQPWHS